MLEKMYKIILSEGIQKFKLTINSFLDNPGNPAMSFFFWLVVIIMVVVKLTVSIIKLWLL